MNQYILILVGGIAWLLFGTANAVVAAVVVATAGLLFLYWLGARALAKQQAELAEELAKLGDTGQFIPPVDQQSGIVPAEEIDKADNSSRPGN